MTGKTGVVEEVTLRYVRLRDYDGVVHFIPNSLVTTVSNSTMGFGYAVLKVGIAYDSDIELALRLMGEAVEALRRDPDFGPKSLYPIEIAGVDDLAESSVNLKARVKTLPQEQWKVRRELLRRIKAVFDAHGIEIPFPQRDLHVRSLGDDVGAALARSREGSA